MQLVIKGLKAAEATVAEFDDKPLKKRLKRGVLLAVKPEKARLQAAAPRGKTGNLRRSISARQGKVGISAVVGPKGKVAFYRHMVIGGTKAHSLSGQGSHSEYSKFPDGSVRKNADLQHPGTKPNPFVDRVQAQDERAITERVEQVVFEVLRSGGHGPGWHG